MNALPAAGSARAAIQKPAESPSLVGIDPCLAAVFPDPETAPNRRTFTRWMAAGFFPHHKIGKRVFLDPVEVRRALDRRFKVNAVAAQ